MSMRGHSMESEYKFCNRYFTPPRIHFEVQIENRH